MASTIDDPLVIYARHTAPCGPSFTTTLQKVARFPRLKVVLAAAFSGMRAVQAIKHYPHEHSSWSMHAEPERRSHDMSDSFGCTSVRPMSITAVWPPRPRSKCLGMACVRQIAVPNHIIRSTVTVWSYQHDLTSK